MNLYWNKQSLDQGHAEPHPLRDLYQAFARSSANVALPMYRVEERAPSHDYQPAGARWIMRLTRQGRDNRGYEDEYEQWAGPFSLDDAREEQERFRQCGSRYRPGTGGDDPVIKLVWHIAVDEMPLWRWLERELGDGPWTQAART